MSVQNSRNLPSFGHNLANPPPSPSVQTSFVHRPCLEYEKEDLYIIRIATKRQTTTDGLMRLCVHIFHQRAGANYAQKTHRVMSQEARWIPPTVPSQIRDRLLRLAGKSGLPSSEVPSSIEWAAAAKERGGVEVHTSLNCCWSAIGLESFP